jgi:hypothetical protein
MRFPRERPSSERMGPGTTFPCRNVLGRFLKGSVSEGLSAFLRFPSPEGTRTGRWTLSKGVSPGIAPLRRNETFGTPVGGVCQRPLPCLLRDAGDRSSENSGNYRMIDIHPVPGRTPRPEDQGGSGFARYPQTPQGVLSGSVQVSRTSLGRLPRDPTGRSILRVVTQRVNNAHGTGSMGEEAHASSPIVILIVFSGK